MKTNGDSRENWPRDTWQGCRKLTCTCTIKPFVSGAVESSCKISLEVNLIK